MVDVYRANRQFERFLFLTPHESKPDESEGKLIATITFDYEHRKVIIQRVGEPLVEV